MAAGGGATDGGESEAGIYADAEGQLLEGELHDAECMLIGEVQQIESLAKENKNKVEELRGLKEDVRTLQERNEYHVSMLQDEHASVQQELAHRLAVLREQATQLGLKHERYKVVARLNEAGAAQVESLLLKMERRTKTHGEEVHATRQEVLHLRQQLESTFRKTLEDLGGTYRRKAFEALAIEAKTGWRANKCLREEMALQEVGVLALSERHVEESKKEGKFTGELKQLRRLKHSRKTALTELQRETRANTCYLDDIQDTRERFAAAENKLKRELEKQGVPSGSLEEVGEMAFMEREECRRLNKVKLRWRRRAKEVMRAIIPSISDPRLDVSTLSSSSSTISTSTPAITFSSFGNSPERYATTRSSASVDAANQPRRLQGSKSAPPGMDGFAVRETTSVARRSFENILANQTDVDAGWRARVGHVVERWSRADRFPLAATDSGGCGTCPHETDILASAGGDRPSEEALPGQGRMVQRKGKKSGSMTALGSARTPSLQKHVGTISSNSPGSHLQESDNDDKQFVSPTSRTEAPKEVTSTPSGSASRGHVAFRRVVDEDPWEKKRRMERVVRRRDAGLRAKGLAVNSGRSRSPRKSRRHHRVDAVDDSVYQGFLG